MEVDIMSSALASEEIEYNIYTFDFPKDGRASQMNKWKKYRSLPSHKSAIKEAKKLGNTRKFQKIEIKKKYKDMKKNKTTDITVKVLNYDNKSLYNYRMLLTSVIFIGIIIFFITYYLDSNPILLYQKL